MDCQLYKKMPQRDNSICSLFNVMKNRVSHSGRIYSGYYLVHLVLLSMVLVTNALPPVIRIGELKLRRTLKNSQSILLLYYLLLLIKVPFLRKTNVRVTLSRLSNMPYIG